MTYFSEALAEHRDLFNTISELESPLKEAAKQIVSALNHGNKVLFCGNGGSAADAQHFAAELTGRFEKNRKALAALALTTDSSAITAVGNDFGFEKIFSRQVEALANSGDVLVGISTSGKSPNVLEAFLAAKKIGCTLVAFTGKDGAALGQLSDYLLAVPSTHTARIQELHVFLGHVLCGLIEEI